MVSMFVRKSWPHRCAWQEDKRKAQQSLTMSGLYLYPGRLRGACLLDLSQRSLGHAKHHHQTQQEPAARKEDRRAKLVREYASQRDRERIYHSSYTYAGSKSALTTWKLENGRIPPTQNCAVYYWFANRPRYSSGFARNWHGWWKRTKHHGFSIPLCRHSRTVRQTKTRCGRWWGNHWRCSG
jgi:hypothetical protein